MGSTYETLLVAADLDATVDALRDAGVTAVVVPLADERVAVLPGLPPQALTTAFRHCDPADFPAAVVLG
jgi:hypothetical protein